MFANNASLRPSTTKMMDDSAAPDARPSHATSDAPAGRSRVLLLVVTLGLVTAGALWFLFTHGASYASGSDASGYFNSARLLDEGKVSTPVRTITGLEPPGWSYYYQQPLGFSVHPETKELIPTYPIGLPWHLLLAARLLGWNKAALLVNALSVVMIGILTAWLGRRMCGLDWAWTAVAVALLMACPLFVFFSLQPMSDVLATMWTLLAVAAAWQSRAARPWALLAGAALGIAVLVRPTNLLVVLPLCLLLGLDWRRWLLFVVGGMPFAIIQAHYNLQVFGEILTTGYGDVGSLLKTDFVPHNALHFARWIPQLLSPLVVLALGLPWLLRKSPRVVLTLGLWAAALVGFYVFYYHSGETWWYLRFILPVFPWLLLGAAMVAQHLAAKLSSAQWRVILAAMTVLLAVNYQTGLNRRLDVLAIGPAEKAYYHTANWLKAYVPEDAIMVAMQTSGALQFYTDFPLVRYDLVDARHFAHFVAVARQQHRPVIAPLFPFEIDRVVTAKLGGDWKQIATVHHITIWQLNP